MRVVVVVATTAGAGLKRARWWPGAGRDQAGGEVVVAMASQQTGRGQCKTRERWQHNIRERRAAWGGANVHLSARDGQKHVRWALFRVSECALMTLKSEG